MKYIFAIRYLHRPVMSGPGLYDPTSIMNADQLSKAMKEGWIKLAFYLLSFFYYLYRYVFSLYDPQKIFDFLGPKDEGLKVRADGWGSGGFS